MSNSILNKYKPSELKLCQYWDTFGNSETEVSAYWVVWFLQERDKGWEPFTYGEIDDFYNKKRGKKGHAKEHFSFNRLLPGDPYHMTAKSFMSGSPEYRSNPRGIRPLEGSGREQKYVVEDSFVCALVSKGYIK